MGKSKKKNQKGMDDDRLLKKYYLAGEKVIDDMSTKIHDEVRTKGDLNGLLPKDLRKKQEQIEREAAKDLMEKVINHRKKAFSNIGSYGDGDQSPLMGDDAQFLKYQWSTGMDCNPLNPLSNYLSGWLRALWWGDFEEVMRYVTMMKKDQVGKLLENRESVMNMSAIFQVVAGARTFRGDRGQLQECRIMANNMRAVKEDHEKILKKLIELGANIQAKDVAGYTPLHHCLTSVSNSITVSMARELLQAGADPNAKNRFGCTPLHEPVMAANFENIKLLLKFGADPDIEDNDGVSCRYLGRHSKIAELFSRADKEIIKQARSAAKEDAGGCLWRCKVCQVNSDTKRCTGCYMVWYCGEKCQNVDWPDHKQECKDTRRQYKKVIMRVQWKETVMNHATRKFHVSNAGDLPTKKHFPVKVQVGFGDDPLLIYNKDRSLIGNLHREKQEEIFDSLVRAIKEKGYKGLKGYFYAIYLGNDSVGDSEATKTMKINPVNILPLMDW